MFANIGEEKMFLKIDTPFINGNIRNIADCIILDWGSFEQKSK